MNTSGVTRLLELFSEDIKQINYDVDGAEHVQSVFNVAINNNEMVITFELPSGEIGTIDNITIVGQTQDYDTVLTTFSKTNDKATVRIPYEINVT